MTQPSPKRAFGEDGLGDRVVNFMRSGMIEIFPFQVNLGSGAVGLGVVGGEAFGEIQGGGSSYIVAQQSVEFPLKVWIVAILGECRFQFG
jgi:hypothetical protein